MKNNIKYISVRCMYLVLVTIFFTQSMAHAQTVTVIPEKAYNYVDGIGFNTHLKWNTSVYYTAFESVIYPKLKKLGIKHIRDAVPYKSFIGGADTTLIRNRFIKLYDSLGIKVAYLTDSRKVIDSLYLRDSAAYLSVFKNSAKLRQTIQYLEGFNEPDLSIFKLYPANWDTLTYKIQKGLWQKAKSMPELQGIPIVNTSLVTYWTIPSRPNKVAAMKPHISNYFDMANFHTYDSGGANWKMFPGTYYDLSKKFFDTVRKAKPWVVTEIGYENALDWNKPTGPNYQPSSYHYLSENSSGKYYSVMFMEMYKRGAKKVYAYEFIDQKTTDQSNNEMNFGILHTDGTEKPAYKAIKNTIDIMKDVSQAFAPAPFTFTMSGDTSHIRSSVYQKADGRYYLALWQGQPNGVNYDYTNFTDLPADSQAVNITFQFTAPQIKIYQPFVSASPVHSYQNQSSLAVQVPDHLLLIEITPATTGNRSKPVESKPAKQPVKRPAKKLQ